MFKLAKIEGSGTNQAEPIRIPTAPSLPYKAFCAYTNIDGFLADTTNDAPPTHIALENLGPDEKDTVLCYRILDNMIFEVSVTGSFSSMLIGQKYKIKIDSDGAGIGITPQIGGHITVYDSNGAMESGDKVYVRIEK